MVFVPKRTEADSVSCFVKIMGCLLIILAHFSKKNTTLNCARASHAFYKSDVNINPASKRLIKNSNNLSSTDAWDGYSST